MNAKEELLIAINRAMERINDLSLLDLILRILIKSEKCQ